VEHDIAEAAIGRHGTGALDALDPAVRRLALGAVVEVVAVLAEVELVAVGPDAAERDVVAALAERHREGELEARHLGGGPEALAGGAGALLVRGDGLELRAPDDVAADPHAPPQLPDRRALAGVGDRHLVELGRLVAARRQRVGQQAVDDTAPDGAQQSAHDAAERTAEGGAQRRAGRTKDERGHG